MDDIVQQDNLIVKTNRMGNPAWVKGMKSPNPKGQALGNEYLQTIFKQGFDLDRKKHKDNIIVYAFKQARKDNTVLIALLKKLLPDLLKQEGAVAQVYAPRVVNYIAVYNNDRPNDATPRELGNTGSGEVPGSTKPEDKI